MSGRASKLQFSKDISTQISELYEKDNYKNIYYIGLDWSIIISSILLANKYHNLITYCIAIFLIGSRMRALENLLHNGSHGMLFANRTVNLIVTKLLCAYPIFLSYNLYRQSHMDHHRWFGNVNHDPDLIRYIKLGIDKLPYSPIHMLLTILKMFILIGIPKYVYGTISATLLHSDRNNELIQRVLYIVIVFSITSYFWSFDVVLKFWLIPYFTIFQMIRYLAEISEHGGLYGTSEREIDLARNNTDNFMSFFIYAHSDNYHLIHHLFPAVSHFNMKKAHKILLGDPEYKQAHTCHGYFFNFNFLGLGKGKTTFKDLTV